MNSPQIILEAGSEAKKFSVPKDILSYASEFFSRALQEDRFKEGRENKITLPEDPADVVAAFIHFAYQENLVFEKHPDTSRRDKELCLCFKLWNFGEKYLMQRLQNMAIEHICDLLRDSKEQVPLDVLTTCFQATTERSPTRIIVTHYIVHAMSKDKAAFSDAEALAANKGFLRQFHASESALRTLPAGDFPRYRKRVKFADIFYVPLSESEGSKNDLEVRSSLWNDPKSNCQHCGWSSAMLHVKCEICLPGQCYCPNRSVMHQCNVSLVCARCFDYAKEQRI